MKRIFIAALFCIVTTTVAIAKEDPKAAERYQREAEYYQRQAEGYCRDAESYLRDARRKENDAAYYLRNEDYGRARDCYRSAATAMDWYRTKINSAERATATAQDYLKRAADALR